MRKGNGRGGGGAPRVRAVSGVGGCCRGGALGGGGGASACGSLPKKGMRQKTCQRRDPPYGGASLQCNVLRVEMVVLRDGDDGLPLQHELNGGAQEWVRGDYGASRGELSQ